MTKNDATQFAVHQQILNKVFEHLIVQNFWTIILSLRIFQIIFSKILHETIIFEYFNIYVVMRWSAVLTNLNLTKIGHHGIEFLPLDESKSTSIKSKIQVVTEDHYNSILLFSSDIMVEVFPCWKSPHSNTQLNQLNQKWYMRLEKNKNKKNSAILPIFLSTISFTMIIITDYR